MDSNYANPGGGVGLGGIGTAAGVSSSATDRYATSFYKDPVSCQRSSAYSGYDPYGGNVTGVRSSSVYPYDAEAEFKERTGMGKAKSVHLQMAGSSIPSNNVKQYNQNSCYGSYNQSAVGVTPESANYYAYAYDHHHYTQQQQYHQQQQYKYKVAAQQQQQQQQQLQQQQQSASMKMSPPDYGYAPYHHHQHPYYHPHYHHHQQKGGVGAMKTLPDASAIPYVNSKMLHSASMGGAAARTPQYPANYTYHPQSYPSAGGHHHTYQSQSVCEDSRWMWNTSNNSTINGTEYSNSCRSGYPSSGKQTTMWPSVPVQYQNTMSTGYPAGSGVSNQNCCQSAQTAAANYYPPQQYTKYSTDFNGTNNDLYSNSQPNSALPPAPTTAQAKVYTDLNTPQGNAYQTINALSSMSYHQPRGDCSVSTTLDFNTRYLQQQQTDSPSSSSSSTSSYYYHNLHPYQAYSNSGHQQPLQVDTKINLTTKSQSLRDFLTSWNEDEDECSDRTMSSSDVPFIEQLHLSAEHFTPNQEVMSNPIVENHLQFKGSFTSRPKIHVGITVDSTVESDQYINLPDIIIDIEKSNKEVVSVNETAPLPKIEKEEITIKQEKPEEEDVKEKLKDTPLVPKKRKLSRLSRLQRIRLAKRIQLKSRKQMLRRQIRRVKNPPTTATILNPQSLKCLCVSLINSEKFRNRILGPSVIDSLIHTTSTNNEIQQISSSSKTTDPYPPSHSPSSSVIPKLSDLCKNALNSSFDRDVLVINLDEILDSDNLFVVQCDINENILENYVDELQQEPASDAETPPPLPPLPPQQQGEPSSINSVDLVEILNDNNNNYNSSNNIPPPPPTEAVNNSPSTIIDTTVTPKRCCSVTEVSNLPLANAVEHNNFNLTTNPLPPAPPSPSSNSCPAALCRRRRTHSHSRSRSPSLSPPTSVSLIGQTCPTTAGHHEPLHEVLYGIVKDDDDDDGGHHDNLSNDSDLLMLTTSIPSIHHEEIVPDNLQKFQNEKFLKYLHAKYVQGNLSQFYHANRIIKKYKRRIIKKMLNIVVR